MLYSPVHHSKNQTLTRRIPSAHPQSASRPFCLCFHYLLIFFFSPLLVSTAWANDVAIGVLAYDGKPQAFRRWQPTADYLSRHMTSHHFQIMPLTHEEFEHAINKGMLDFILTNPGHYVRLEVQSGVSRLATFRSRYHDQVLTQFSAVLFARKDGEITSLESLKGHTLAAVSKNAFGGFQLGQDLLHQHGIDVLKAMKILWLGFPHADVVSAVMAGKADAGIVRAGTLEKMANQGQLDFSQIRILAEQQTPGFPLRHSVALYPEWPFAKLPDTDMALAKAVAITLMQMDSNATAAQKAGGAGWTIPLSYTTVHDVLRRLQAEPYPPVPLSFATFWKAYPSWIILVIALFLFSLLTLLRFVRTNRQLQTTQQTLQTHQEQLEAAVQQRTDELHQTNLTLHDEVASHIQAEKTLHDGCEALQDLSTIFIRDDLNRQQRLQSIVESVRHYLGAETALLCRHRGSQLEVCCSSPPASHGLSPPLSKTLAQQSIHKKRVFLQKNTPDWHQYIASPVFTHGALCCLLEVATSQQHHTEHGDTQAQLSSDLSLKILALISQWLSYEMSALEREQAADRKVSRLRQRFEHITPREKEVLGLLVQGQSTKNIARALNLSTKTIEMYRANLLRKTQAHSSTEIVQLAVLAKIFPEVP